MRYTKDIIEAEKQTSMTHMKKSAKLHMIRRAIAKSTERN